MDVHVSVAERVPVLALNGRFDGLGAQHFDKATVGLRSDAVHWVLDMSGVRYVSSVGLRSLVALEKTLRARGGGLILAGVTPFVGQVLQISHLDGWLRLAPDTADALAMVRASTMVGPLVEHEASGRLVRIRRLALDASLASAIEWWDPAAEDGPSGDRLISTSLGELGFAFGTAGFGETLGDARWALGCFVSTPAFAGVLAADALGVSDFVAGEESLAAPVHVAQALGVSGAPALVAEVSGSAPFHLLDVLDGLFDAATEQGLLPPVLGFVAIGEGVGDAGGVLATVVAFDATGVRSTIDRGGRLPQWPGQIPLASGRAVVGGAFALQAGLDVSAGADLRDTIRSQVSIDTLKGVVGIREAGTLPLARAVIWVFVPGEFKGGAEKLLRVTVDGGDDWRADWDAIARRLYGDCRSVTLTPLAGGYMSKTFRAVAYDREGRRTLPTVLKIGPTALTAREEEANRQYVARFILNNGTTVLGGAQAGEWAGLRYNFLGITGSEGRLVWLREYYMHRPVADVLGLFDQLLTRVLKPWYAQPKWEQVWLFRDHTPLRLFPNLLEVAERELGLSADAPTFDCHELGLELPNPFHFLKHEYSRRAAETRLWYTAICHGDLNLQNVLVDERENLYVIDFSETRPRNAVSDFARIEPILKFEMTRLDTEEELGLLLEFEVGLTSVASLGEPPPFRYRGDDPMVARSHAVITLLRRYADTVTLFERDMVPYWLAALEWTYPVVCYSQVSFLRKRYAACSAALICRAIQQQEHLAATAGG